MGLLVTLQQDELVKIFSPSCRIHYLKITNGFERAQYCGDQLMGRNLVVPGNYVVLTFHRVALLENKTGFEIFFALEIPSKSKQKKVTT